MKKLAALFVCVCFPAFGQSLYDYMDFIEHWEGRRSEAYYCSEGYLTIGVGHRITHNSGRLSNKEIDCLLRDDTLKAIHAAKQNVSSFNSQPKIVKLILVDMAFNLGQSGLSRFKKTISACNAHNYMLMSKEMMDSKWYRQTGRRAKHHTEEIGRLAK